MKAVIAAESAAANAEQHLARLDGVRVVLVPDALFQALATTETTQGVIALVKPPEWTLDDVFQDRGTGGRSLVVVLDAVQDPGNAGNIVRTAEAFGATGAIFPKGAVSPFNAKTLRASAGSLFRLPFITGLDYFAVRTALSRHRVNVYAAMPQAKKAVDRVDLTSPVAFIVGSEGQGVSESLLQNALAIRIPTRGVESLNAAMAAGVLLYEASRQRRLPQDDTR